jgi:hypothetical protein
MVSGGNGVRNHFIFEEKAIVFGYGQREMEREMVSRGKWWGNGVRNHFIFEEKAIVFGYGQSAASGGWWDDLSCAEPRELPLSAVPRNCA